jgi:hypothetical protein
MPYIGNTPALDYISYAVQNFTVTAGTTSYTLDYSVANENDIRLVINNVIQRPGVSYAYSATGTTLTLTSATLATDTMYAVFIGRAVQTVTPPTNSVGLSQLTATGTKDATTFLRGDNTFATVSTTPTIQRFTSGSGTYTTPSGVKYIIVEMSGAGGGGSGGGTGGWGAGGNGGNTTFGTSLHTASGGTGGPAPWSGGGGAGGSVTLGSGGTQIYNSAGTAGGGSGVAPDLFDFALTGMGGQNLLGGGAPSVTYIGGGAAGITNSGGGGSGGGGGTSNAAYTGTGGGAGGYMRFLISSPSATYAYAIGAAGTAGTAGSGSSAAAGGAGGSGVIIVTEYYN